MGEEEGGQPRTDMESSSKRKLEEIQITKQKAQEIVARLVNDAKTKRPRFNDPLAIHAPPGPDFSQRLGKIRRQRLPQWMSRSYILPLASLSPPYFHSLSPRRQMKKKKKRKGRKNREKEGASWPEHTMMRLPESVIPSANALVFRHFNR